MILLLFMVNIGVWGEPIDPPIFCNGFYSFRDPLPGDAFTMIGDSRTHLAMLFGDWHSKELLGRYRTNPYFPFIQNSGVSGSKAEEWDNLFFYDNCLMSKPFNYKDKILIMLGGNDILWGRCIISHIEFPNGTKTKICDRKNPGVFAYAFDIFNGNTTKWEIINAIIEDLKRIKDKLRSWNKQVYFQGQYNINPELYACVDENNIGCILKRWFAWVLDSSLLDLRNKTYDTFVFPQTPAQCIGGWKIAFWFPWIQRRCWWIFCFPVIVWIPWYVWDPCLVWIPPRGQNDPNVQIIDFPFYILPSKKYFGDPVHPNKDGFSRISDYLAPELRRYWLWW